MKDILIKLNQLPDLNRTNVNVLCNQISTSLGKYNTFITETIEQLNLTQLSELKDCGKLYPKGRSKIRNR